VNDEYIDRKGATRSSLISVTMIHLDGRRRTTYNDIQSYEKSLNWESTCIFYIVD